MTTMLRIATCLAALLAVVVLSAGCDSLDDGRIRSTPVNRPSGWENERSGFDADM